MIENLICIGSFQEKNDKTIKNVFRNKNEEIIEMTFLQNKKDMDVFCAPSHHFCSLGCKMCHLTNEKLSKKMIPIQYNDFLEAFIKTAYKNAENSIYKKIENNPIPELRRTGKKKCLISFMGVGDPLLNLELLEQIYLHEDEIKKMTGYENIGYALSTIFPIRDINKLKHLVDLGMPLKVHFSLHTPIDEKRFNLLPNTKVNVKEAFELLVEYRKYITKSENIMKEFSKTHKIQDPTEIHYTLIDGVNDSDEELKMIIELIEKYKIQFKFILFNPIGEMKRSEKLQYWINEIKRHVKDVNVVIYEPPGRGIGSSCGEFTRHYYHEKIESKEDYDEFKKWEKEYRIVNE